MEGRRLNDAERNQFKCLVSKFCKLLRNRKIKTYRNFMPSRSSALYAIKSMMGVSDNTYSIDDESFVYYDEQEHDRLKEGSDTCCFYCRINYDNGVDYYKLIDVINKFMISQNNIKIKYEEYKGSAISFLTIKYKHYIHYATRVNT